MTAEDSVAQAIVHLHAAQMVFSHIFLGSGNGFFDGEAVEAEVDVRLHVGARRVGDDALFGVETFLAHVATLNKRNDWQAEVLCESVVAAVVSRYSHDGARSVAREHIVAHPDWVRLAGERVDGVAAGEHAGYLLVNHAFAFGALLHLVEISVDFGFLLGSGEFSHQFAFGSEHHEGNAEHSVGASGEDGEVLVAVLHVEFNLGTFRAAYPVALSFLDAVGPVDEVEAVEQALSVSRHAQAPLAHLLLHHRITATGAEAVNHLVVGKHCAEFRAPVHHCFAKESDAPVHERVGLLALVHGVPIVGSDVQFLGAGSVEVLSAFGSQMLNKLFDWLCLLQRVVVVAVEHFLECPLGPVVVCGVAGAHFAVPVVAEPDFVELLAIAVDIVHGGHLGVLTGLNGILFGRQAIGVVAHGMQHVETLQAFVARIDVACNVAERVTYVQSGAAWIGEHVEHIEFRARVVNLSLVDFIVFPVFLPLLLDFFVIIFHR